MTPRQRSARNRGLPTGLRERNGYWSWTDPNGKEWGIGRVSRAQAIAEASQAMLRMQSAPRVSLADRIEGKTTPTLGAWMKVYERKLIDRQLAPNTMKSYESIGRKVVAAFGADSLLRDISTRRVAKLLQDIKDAGNARMAQAVRSYLTDMFRSAIGEGYIEANPVSVTDRLRAEVKRSRLTLDVFLVARERAEEVWLRNAMDLAIVTAQRREDIATARFSDFRDDHWYLQQHKTKTLLAIPTRLRLDAVGLSVADVVRQCRSTRVISHHLVHQTHRRGNSPTGRHIWIDTISRRFSILIDSLGIDWLGRQAPTFHEIRSLAARLYTEQGGVSVQGLLGHKDARTTGNYVDARGQEYTLVKVA